jgi:GSH-dependent disulfide-bond oxidoreductase
MIELFTWPTPNGTKPSIMLEEVGVPYSVHLVNLGSGEQHAPQFLAVSPNGKIPAIVDHNGVGGPRTVFESGAILVYLAEKTGLLLPASGGRREQAMSWLFWAMSGVGPTLGQLLHFVSAEDGSASAVRRFVGEAVRLVHVLERRLGEAAYLAEEYSIADVGAFTWVNFALPTIRRNSRDALGATPTVDRWLGEINDRPAVQRGLRAPKIVVGRAKPIS